MEFFSNTMKIASEQNNNVEDKEKSDTINSEKNLYLKWKGLT